MQQKTKTTLKYFGWYIFSIFSFGVVYWGYWFFNPDSFIVNEQFNLHPFSSKKRHNTNHDLVYFQLKKDSLLSLHSSTQNQLKLKKSLKDSLLHSSRYVFEKFDSTRWESVEKYKEEYIPDSLKAKISYLKESIEILETAPNTNSLKLANLRVELAHANVKKAKLEVESSQYVLDNLGSFGDTFLLKDFKVLDSIYYKLEYSSIPDDSFKLRTITLEIETLKFQALDELAERVTYVDFLLFSASNASTVTYGELTPNDTIIRILLISQAFLCIFLIAFFTEHLLK